MHYGRCHIHYAQCGKGRLATPIAKRFPLHVPGKLTKESPLQEKVRLKLLCKSSIGQPCPSSSVLRSSIKYLDALRISVESTPSTWRSIWDHLSLEPSLQWINLYQVPLWVITAGYRWDRYLGKLARCATAASTARRMLCTSKPLVRTADHTSVSETTATSSRPTMDTIVIRSYTIL